MGKKISDKKIMVYAMAFCIVSFSTSLLAVENTSSAYARYNIDPETAGMGHVTTQVNNASSVAWNPSALAHRENGEISIINTTAFETRYISAFFAQKGWGIGYANASLGGIKITERNENNLASQTGTSEFEGHVIYAATAMKFLPQFSAGITTKYLYQKIGTTHASGVGADIAATYTPAPWLQMDIVAENGIKPTLTWNTDTKETLPLILKTGLRATLIPGCFTVASNYVKEENREGFIAVGCSYAPIELMTFRAGLNDGHLTIGTGLILDRLRADISWEKAPQKSLDDIYRFSIGMML
jgi:hypothetical protein